MKVRDVIKFMKSAGNGATTKIWFNGHAFNVVNRKGWIIFIDAQGGIMDDVVKVSTKFKNVIQGGNGSTVVHLLVK